MSDSRFSPESELPCTHCGTLLHDEVRFCFECGAPVVPELSLPAAPEGADEELRTAAFSPVSIRPIADDPGLEPGEPIEIESLEFDVVVDEVPIVLDDEHDDEIIEQPIAPQPVADPHGTVVAMAGAHPTEAP